MRLDTKMQAAFLTALKRTRAQRVVLPTGEASSHEVARVLSALDKSQKKSGGEHDMSGTTNLPFRRVRHESRN